MCSVQWRTSGCGLCEVYQAKPADDLLCIICSNAMHPGAVCQAFACRCRVPSSARAAVGRPVVGGAGGHILLWSQSASLRYPLMAGGLQDSHCSTESPLRSHRGQQLLPQTCGAE
jgi:hypothetical protein